MISIIVGLICASIVMERWNPAGLLDNATVYSTVAGISATLRGFALASVTILIGVLHSSEFDVLRAGKTFGEIYTDFKRAIVFLGITTAYALVASALVLADFANTPLFGIHLWLTGMSAAAMAHAVGFLWLVINTHVNAEAEN